MLQRQISTHIKKYIESSQQKILFIWGPRRSGKTTLLEQISKKIKAPIFNFDESSDQQKFPLERVALKKLVTSVPIILIDEVQNYPKSTLALKLIFDEFGHKIIATGSSELKQKSKHFDSLTGRYIEHFCLPLSLSEIISNYSIKEYLKQDFLKKTYTHGQIFGNYPEVYTQKNEDKKIDLLQNILDTYVLKDIISLYNLQNAALARKILLKIALQIGQEVSLREIANSLGATAPTVANYIEIFIKNYVLIAIPSFKTNARRAVSANQKIFFLDLGIRNILVRDFRDLNLRPDSGLVFENYVVSEIFKKKFNQKLKFQEFFYREYSGKEVDIVLESYKKNYRCFEVKKKKQRVARVFPISHSFTKINCENLFSVVEKI